MILAADIGGTTCKLGILSEDLTILKQWSIKTDTSNNGVNILPNIYQSFKEASVKGYSIDQVICVGLGVPGPIHFSEGSINGAVNLNWNGTKYVRDEFEKLINKPVVVDNDANVAALGEQIKGAGKNEKDVVCITLGTGVGGGVISDYELLHGSNGCAGELGHIKVDLEERFQCNCGNKGCLETVASATGILNIAHYYINQGESTTLKGEFDAKDVFEAAQCNDALALKVVDEVSAYLGYVISIMSVTTNPKYFIIGGGVSAAGDFLTEKIDKYYRALAFQPSYERVEILAATLGNDAGIIGAAALALQQTKKA